MTCGLCGNENIYPKGSEMTCPYCLHFYGKAMEHEDVNRLVQYLILRGGQLAEVERRGPLVTVGNFMERDIVRCVNCGDFHFGEGRSMCVNCGMGGIVGDENYFHLANGFMCKTCLQFTEQITDTCRGCQNQLEDKRKVTNFGHCFVGRVYNNLQIVRQYRTPQGILCDTKCLWLDCKETHIGVQLYDVVKGKVFCENPKEFMNVHCDGCGNTSRLTNTEVYSGDYRCSKCGIEIGLNLRLHANDSGKYTDFKVQHLVKTYGYNKEIKNGALIKDSGVPNIYRVAPIWNTRHLIMEPDEIDNMQFRLGGKVGDGFFSTDVIWED